MPNESQQNRTDITPELIQSIYAEVEKHATDVETLRTVLISLFTATLTGLSDEQVEAQIMRIVTLTDNNRKPQINPEIKSDAKKET